MRELKKPVTEIDERRGEHLDHSTSRRCESNQTTWGNRQNTRVQVAETLNSHDTIRSMPAVSVQQTTPTLNRPKSAFDYLETIIEQIEHYYTPTNSLEEDKLLKTYEAFKKAEEKYAKLLRYHLNLDYKAYNELENSNTNNGDGDQKLISTYSTSLENGLANLSPNQKALLDLSYSEMLRSKIEMDNERNSLPRTIDKRDINKILIKILDLKTMVIQSSMTTGREKDASVLLNIIDKFYQIFEAELAEIRGENDYKQVFLGEEPLSKMQQSIKRQERIKLTLEEIKIILQEMIERGIIYLNQGEITKK